jgi:glycosyltransferase involved in cell wall biosynthesis
MRRLRILQLVASLSVGGAERLLPGLVGGLDRERFDVRICSLGRSQALADEIGRLGVPVHVLGIERFYDPRAAAALARFVRAGQIDVIHTHLTEADVVGRIVGRALGVAVVSTLHSLPEGYERQNIHRRALQKLTARHLATRLVAVSPGVRQRFIREWRLPEERIVAINNSVPMEAYLRLPEGVPVVPGAGPLVTNIGRLSEPKAQDVLLRAAAQVLRARPGTRFWIVGQGPLEARLRAQAAALGISEQVTFTGLRRDIPQILAQSDLFVLSSRWEGLPVTAVEAMAAARPCVLTRVGGVPDLIDDGVEGRLVPPESPEALAAALLELLNDPVRRLAMGRAARARVQRDFGMERYIAQHAALYEAAVGRPRDAERMSLTRGA